MEIKDLFTRALQAKFLPDWRIISSWSRILEVRL